jgi:hypothetical protein
VDLRRVHDGGHAFDPRGHQGGGQDGGDDHEEVRASFAQLAAEGADVAGEGDRRAWCAG